MVLIMKKEGILIIISPNKYYKFFYSFLNLFNKYMPDETIFKHYSIDDIIKLTKKKWKVKEGGCMDSTIFSDGERDINFDQYLKKN